MNNSLKLDVDTDFAEKPDTTQYREREAKLVRMLEALHGLNENRDWSTLKNELFDGVLTSIENRMKSESDKDEVNLPTLYRLQGEKKWAKRYSSLDDLIAMYRTELANIRKQTLEN